MVGGMLLQAKQYATWHVHPTQDYQIINIKQ